MGFISFLIFHLEYYNRNIHNVKNKHMGFCGVAVGETMNTKHGLLWVLAGALVWVLLTLWAAGGRAGAATIPPPGTPFPTPTPRLRVTAIPLPTAPPMQPRYRWFFPLAAK